MLFLLITSAVANPTTEEGEARSGRLHIFISSVLSSLGAAVFGQNQEGDMASRPIVPPQPRVFDKHKLDLADGNNRRALGDIGNLVNIRHVEGKPKPQILHPVTRSYREKFCDNTQAVAITNKKAIVTVTDGENMGKGGAKVAKPRATINPEPVTVIEISPDSVEEIDSISGRNKGGGSSRRKVQTLTSILTHDIDAADIEDQLAVVDYVEDIYKFYKLAENSSRILDYMNSQPEINDRMRAILVDWLIEVHNKFELMHETLYLAIHIIDQYLSMKKVPREELQLVGMTAMLIACKYEEIWAPEINDFVCISDAAYCREQILFMEKAMLDKLEWNLTVPTPYVFIMRFLKASASDKEMEDMTFFLAELSLMHYSMIMYCPSMIAASAVYAARCTLKKTPIWNNTLEHHTGFDESQLMDCAKELVNFHSVAAYSKLKGVYKKYSSPQRNVVSLLPPVSSLTGVSTESKIRI